MPYFRQDARASFSSILTRRLMAVIIATSYWCSRCCHPFMLTYSSSKTVHQRIVSVRRSSSFSMTLLHSLIQTYGFQTVLILTPQTIEYEVLCRIMFIRCQFEMWPIWSSAWLTHVTDCNGVLLTMLSKSGRRDLRLREKEDISDICHNNWTWTWTHLVVQLNLLS